MSAPPGAGARLALLRVTTLPFESLVPLAGREALAAAATLLDLEERLDREVPQLTEALHTVAGPPPGEGAAPEAPGRRAVIAIRRAIHNRRPVSRAELDKAGRRLPPTLLAALACHLAGRAELAAHQDRYVRAYRAELRRVRQGLLALAAAPAFQEGIRLVSRSLFARCRMLTDADPDRWRHDERHTLAKLTSYAARFTTKSSPNSVFCSTALAWICGGEARVTGLDRPPRTDVALSIAEARKITAVIGADPAAWPAIVPRPNPTLRCAEGVWSFWRPATLRRDNDDEVLCRTRSQPVLELFLEEARRGALRVPQLLAAVSRRAEIEPDELTPFFEKLVAMGILIAELEPPYSCRRPLRFVAESLREAGATAPWLVEIEAVEAEVDALPQRAAGERIAAIDRLEEQVAVLPRARAPKSDELFRVDTAAAIEVVLPERVHGEIEVPLRRCIRLFAGLYPELAFRRGWAERFLSRHAADVDVPLLDLYHGLFEPTPRQRPEAFPAAPPGAEAARALHERTRQLFAARARAVLDAGGDEVELDDSDWEALVGGLPEPAWSAGVLFQVAARSAGDIAAGRWRAVLNALFGAGIALARFAFLHGGEAPDNLVAREVRRGWQPLARAEAILAEVTYNHLGRTANAGLRPVLYEHEIELPGSRANPGCEVIPLRELTVRWETAAERFVLVWERSGAEVIPVLSSGVSPEGFVQFLVEIGRQGLQPLGWFPGFEVPDLTRWPRFVSGNLVLFRRRWRFATGEAPAVPKEGTDADAAGGAFFAATQRWRRRSRLPRHVFLHTAGETKPFYCDLDSPLFVDLLRRLLTPGAEASSAPTILHVTEMLPAPEEMWLRDEHGGHAAELLLHLSGPPAPPIPLAAEPAQFEGGGLIPSPR